jgi:DNA-binding NtrC family response regulator
MRVLIADNDELIRNVLRELLEEADIATGGAESCQSALASMVTDRWDVLLTDLLFPGVRGGLELADEAAVRGIRCIIMSGATDRREEIEAKGLRFLAKPFAAAALLAALAIF